MPDTLPEQREYNAFEWLAKIAYENYGQSTGGVNYLGLPMPLWADLPGAIQNAWIASVMGVLGAYVELIVYKYEKGSDYNPVQNMKNDDKS